MYFFVGIAGREDVAGVDAFDPAALVEQAEFIEMRIFGDDAAKIVPHAADDARALLRGQRRQSEAQILLRAFGDAEPRTDHAEEEAAKCRGPIDR